uniref:Uncharacterized protein n=1 Tax=Zea mays TaxID=4577 RepID=A0A804NNG2_MAIZE
MRGDHPLFLKRPPSRCWGTPRPRAHGRAPLATRDTSLSPCGLTVIWAWLAALLAGDPRLACKRRTDESSVGPSPPCHKIKIFMRLLKGIVNHLRKDNLDDKDEYNENRRSDGKWGDSRSRLNGSYSDHQSNNGTYLLTREKLRVFPQSVLESLIGYVAI